MTMMPEIQCTIKLIYIITGSKFKSTQMLSHNRIGFIFFFLQNTVVHVHNPVFKQRHCFSDVPKGG